MKEKLSLDLETSDKINKKIYRMGFDSQTLLVILSTMLIVWMILFAVFGFYNFVFGIIFIYGFLKLSRFMKGEIEKGNLHPIDEYLENMNMPSSVKDDGVMSMLIIKMKNKNNEFKQITSD
jgi:hypothetical protein